MSTPAYQEKPDVPGLLRERRRVSAERRAAARTRDDGRYRLAQELQGAARLTIPQDKGFLVVSPGRISEADPVVAAANGLIDSIGHDELAAHAKKGGFMAKEFLPEEASELGSPYMRFALSENVVAPVADYLGLVPILMKIDVWYSIHRPKSPRKSQLWHLDHIDTTQVKVWIHLDDVTADSGPLTALDAAASDELAESIDYDLDASYRIEDERVADVAGEDALVRFEGPAGTVDFVDTSRCFHFGSRVEAGARPRRLFMCQYLTPYAFKFADHRDQAKFGALAPGASSELETLLLGAA
jgi:hypothetical protein